MANHSGLLDADSDLAEEHEFERPVGQRADSTYQIGAKRTFRSSPTRSWELLASRAGAEAWLGDVPDAWWHGSHGGPGAGDILTTPGGERYEVRSVSTGRRIRLRALGPGAPLTTIQLTITGESGRTSIGLHQEGLPQLEMREPMREHWKRALDRIGALLDEE